MGDTNTIDIESAKINSFLLNDFKNYNIDKLYNKLLNNQYILKLPDYNDTTNNYNDKLLNKTLIDITINNILEDNINYYLDDFKLNNEYISGSIDIDLSYYASNEIKYYSMILDFLTEYYKNLANIIKDKEYLDNKSLYDHEFEIKMRYYFDEDSKIKQLNKNKVLKFNVITSQDISGYKDIVIPNSIDNYRLFEINEGEMISINFDNRYKTFIENYIIKNNYLNFDINKLDYYFLLTKSYLYKFYKLLLNYHISKAIYFYYQNKYKNKVPEINDIISNKFPKIFENFELILNGENNDLSILKIVENTKKKQKVLEEKKKKEINKLSDRIKILEKTGGNAEELRVELNNLYKNGYITTDQAKINDAIRYKKDLHNINNNLIDNEEKIKKLDDTIKRDKSYLNQVNIIMYICIFVLVIIFFTFSITNLTNVNISVAIVLFIISMILYFSSNYYINNSNHEHKKTNLFSNLFNNFIIIENYEDSSSEEPTSENINTLLLRLKGQFSDTQIDNIINDLRPIINDDGYVTGANTEGDLSNRIDGIITAQYNKDSLQYENNITLKKRGEDDFYNLVALSTDSTTSLDNRLSKFFGSPPTTVYDTLYKEIENSNGEVDNIIILPHDGNDDFTQYELNIPSYFGDSFRLTYNSDGDLTQELIERKDVKMDITVVGGGSAGQSFTKPSDVDSDNVGMTELGSGGSGGAVIQKTNFSFTPGKYIIGVGKGGTGNTNTNTDITDTDEENKIKSGRGSYLKKEDSGTENSGTTKNNFIIFACGGIYHDTSISNKKISKSGGRVELVDEIADFKTFYQYNQIHKNIIKIPGIDSVNDSKVFILNNDLNYSKGGEGGNIKLEDISSKTQLFISNEITDNQGYAVFYNHISGEEYNYSKGRKNGKRGIQIENISQSIIPESNTTYDKDKIVKGDYFYISGGGGAIGVCSRDITQIDANSGTKLFIACDEDANIGGSGGIGGGGNGIHDQDGEDGYNGTGSGGGGGGYKENGDNCKGGNGGSGVVIIKYKRQDLKNKFDTFKQNKINEIKTILLRTIANGNLLKLETKFLELNGAIQDLEGKQTDLKRYMEQSDTNRDNIKDQKELQKNEEETRDINLYGYFKKIDGTDSNVDYEIKHIQDDSTNSTIYRKIEISNLGDFLQIIDRENEGNSFVTFDIDDEPNIKNTLKNIFNKETNDNNLIILSEDDVTFLLNNRDNITYIDDIYVPGVVYLRGLHMNYISSLRTYYQRYGDLLNENSNIEDQIAVLDGELSNLDTQIQSLETEKTKELGIKAFEEKRNSDNVRSYRDKAVKQAQGNLCLSIVNELIIRLQRKLQEENRSYTSEKMKLNAQLTRLQNKAIKDKNAAREAKKRALEEQAESEKELEREREELFQQLQSQNLPENKRSFLIDFEFDLDYRIAGNLLDSDDFDIFGEENVKKQNEKRIRFERKIKRELYDALKETYQDTGIDITPNRFEINRISSGNLYDNSRTRQNTDGLTAAEILERAFMDGMEEFTVEEHFAIDTPKTLQENRMVVEMEILPNSKSFFDSQDSTNTARDILYKILNLSSCKSNPTDISEVEPDLNNINIKDTCTTGDKELLDDLKSELRIKRYFRYLTRYRVGAGMDNFIQHYLNYANPDNKDIVKNEVDSSWIDVVKTDGLITDEDILKNTYSKIDDINDNFVEIDRLRFQQETYYDKMNPLLKKEYKKYDEIENNNNIYKKMKHQSDNINTYDIRLKETLINYFVTLSILVSLYLIIIHYINHIVVLLILILIIVVMSIFLLMNIYQIVKTRANKNYWPKENKFLQINI